MHPFAWMSPAASARADRRFGRNAFGSRASTVARASVIACRVAGVFWQFLHVQPGAHMPDAAKQGQYSFRQREALQEHFVEPSEGVMGVMKGGGGGAVVGAGVVKRGRGDVARVAARESGAGRRDVCGERKDEMLGEDCTTGALNDARVADASPGARPARARFLLPLAASEGGAGGGGRLGSPAPLGVARIPYVRKLLPDSPAGEAPAACAASACRSGVNTVGGAASVARGVDNPASPAGRNRRRLHSGVPRERGAGCGGDAKKSSGLNEAPAPAGVDPPAGVPGAGEAKIRRVGVGKVPPSASGASAKAKSGVESIVCGGGGVDWAGGASVG